MTGGKGEERGERELKERERREEGRGQRRGGRGERDKRGREEGREGKGLLEKER